MTRPLVTAYAASLARVASWVIVFGVVFRAGGPDGTASVALLALARGTVGLLSYASLGLTPVLVRLLTRDGLNSDAARRTQATAGLLVLIASTVGLFALLLYVGYLHYVPRLGHPRPSEVPLVFFLIGLGTLLRTASDWYAAPVIAGGKIAADNLRQCAAEVAFVVSVAAFGFTELAGVGAGAGGFGVSGVVLLVLRWIGFPKAMRARTSDIVPSLLWLIALLGVAVVAGQLADWLYAPLNQILISRYLGLEAVAPYAVAIQIDSGLLLLVGGLSAVLLPTAAVAFHEGRLDQLRRQFVLAWSASLLLLAGASIFIFLMAAPLLQLWFHDPMPDARAILPLVLIHTTIGGTAGVGRAVLLAIGRVKAYTISAIAGGIANAVLAYVLLTQTHLGLRGVVLATIVTVTIRCGLWMPWYTLRCLRPPAASPI